jgi:hypothetical protein
METVYIVEHESSFCILYILEDALELIKSETNENYSKDENPFEFTLKVCEMSEKDLSELPEFEGF